MANAMNEQVQHLAEDVVKGGYCIGCGACAAVPGSPFKNRLDVYGRFQATVEPTGRLGCESIDVASVCPFSAFSANEQQIAAELFVGQAYHEQIGFFRSTYAGHVRENEYRGRGTSGGMCSWMLCELLDRGLVNGAVNVHPRTPSKEDGRLFQYGISTSTDDILRGAKSRYYPVDLSDVLEVLRQKTGRYALVGVPCFVKAMRLLARQDPLIRERISFTLSLFCGHLKSTAFADLFAWQVGIRPGDLRGIDFRKKLLDRTASDYGVELTGLINGDLRTVVKPKNGLYGVWWGHGYFKYQACDYCDDVIGETADLSLGDAWLPRYTQDPKGTSIMVVRHPALDAIIKEGIAQQRLNLEHVHPDDVALSQESNYRHRGEGLAYRLYLNDRAAVWSPPKRVAPGFGNLSAVRRKIYESRVKLTAESHPAFREAVEADSFALFRDRMERMAQPYNDLYRPWWRKWASRGKRMARKII